MDGCVKVLDILPHCFLKLGDDVFHLIGIARAEGLRGRHERQVLGHLELEVTLHLFLLIQE